MGITFETHRIGDGSLPEPQKFSGHGGWPVASGYLVPVLGELVHHPHTGKSHGCQQSHPDEMYVSLHGGTHHQHQESDQCESHDDFFRTVCFGKREKPIITNV